MSEAEFKFQGALKLDFIITKHGHLIKLPYNLWAAIICFEVGLDACSLLLAFSYWQQPAG